MTQAIIIVSLFDILLYISFIILLIKRWTTNKAYKRFILFLIISTIWLFVITLEVFVKNLESYSLLAKLDFSIAALAAPLFLIFTIHFPKQNSNLSNKKEFLFFLPTLLLIFAIFKGSIFKVLNFNNVIYNNTLYILYISILILYFIPINATILIKRYKNAKGVLKLQLRYFIFGYLISIALALYLSIHNALISRLPEPIFTILVHLVIIFPICAFYSITRYRLFDIRIIIRKSLIYSILFAILIGLAAFGITLLSKYISSAFNTTFIFGAAFISVALALLFYPAKKLIQKIINKIVFSKTPVYEDQIVLLKQTLQNGKEFKKLFAKMENILRTTLKTEEIFVAIKSHRENSLEEHYSRNLICSPIAQDSPLIKYLTEKRTLLVKEEIPYLIEEDKRQQDILAQAEKFLSKANAEIALPMFQDEKIIGLLLLGKKQNSEPYSANDISFLESFRKDFAYALSNTLLYESALARAKQSA